MMKSCKKASKFSFISLFADTGGLDDTIECAKTKEVYSVEYL